MTQNVSAQTIEIEACYISDGHNFLGHHGKEPGQNLAIKCESVQCKAGQGLVGDRFFGYKSDYKGQITFLEREQIGVLEKELQLTDINPAKFRRNIITYGIDLNTLIGRTFALGALRFQGVEECRPCYWMDYAVAEGAEKFLRGKGGLRARILSDGALTPGSYELEIIS
ncbi:MAG: MOSC domain-containing protein [Verrucomicrobiota bacterium]